MHTGTYTYATRTSSDISWLGYSGNSYPMVEESLQSFSLSDNSLCVMVADEGICWVGTANDVIDDSSSRARFRAALSACTAVFKLDISRLDDVKRSTTAWDVENGQLGGKTNFSLARAV